MNIYISIRKLKYESYIYYYHVSSNDYDGYDFYIGIDPNKKLISFYPSVNFENPIRVLDLNNTNETVATPGIHPRIVWGILIQAMQALDKNIFPDDLDYYA